MSIQENSMRVSNVMPLVRTATHSPKNLGDISRAASMSDHPGTLDSLLRKKHATGRAKDSFVSIENALLMVASNEPPQTVENATRSKKIIVRGDINGKIDTKPGT